MELTRSQKFIEDNKKILGCGKDFFNPDTSYMSFDEWDKKRIHFLLIFATPSAVKAVSSTAAALNDYVITHCPDVFIDFAYVPDASDIKVYDKHCMPYAIGLNSHLDASHFEFVGFSISVLCEVIGMASIMNSFSRCDKPIPLTWTERKDALLGTYPVVYCGGITTACGDIMYGELGDGRQAFPDFSYLGDCCKSDVLFNRYLQAIDTGEVHRTAEDRVYPGSKEDPVEYDECVKVITHQDFVDSLFDCRWIYQPQAYKVVFNDKTQIVLNKKINPKAQDFVRPCYPHEMEDELGIGRTIIPASGDNCGVSQVQVSEGCSAAGACSFCSEGNYTGGWCEKGQKAILRELWESKKYSAAWKFKPFSFNSNYLTDYKGMLVEFLKVFPKVTFLNMRMEELGRDLDAIRMMKLVGNNRMSAPMEGISPRIQNNMLNKCLSETSLYNFMDDMVHMRLTDIKVGAIFTAYEEDEDFQWICDFVDKFKARAAEENGNFPFRLKATPLVHYQLTPCEYLERKSAKKSMLGEHWLTDEWYEKFREHNVFFKVNGFRYSTFIEQCIIDLGRLATKLVYEEIIKKGIGVYSLRSVATDGFVQGLKDLVNVDYFFNDRDPAHYISLSHRIHIDLMGSYIPRARRLVRLKQQGRLFENEPDTRCLKTYEGAKTKCYKFCIKKDPLKIYADVELDEEGNLHGDYREMVGCERCNTNEERAARLNRKIISTKDSNDVMAVARKEKVQKLRFIINRMPGYDVLNPNNTSYTFITKLLQHSDILLKNYHSMQVHSMFWQSDPDESYFTSGYQIVETVWSDYVYDEVKRVIDVANKELKSVQIVDVKRIMMEEKIKLTDLNVYRFESTLPYEIFQNGTHNYVGQIKVKKDIAFEVVQDPTLIPPVYQMLGKVTGYFVCPARHNPFYYLQGFLGVKKVSESKLAASTNISCVMSVRESSTTVCKNCGKESGTISLTTDKNFPFGPKCLIKALMSNEVKHKMNKQ